MSELGLNVPPTPRSYGDGLQFKVSFNPIALRKAKIAYNFGLSEWLKDHRSGELNLQSLNGSQYIIHCTTAVPPLNIIH